MNGFRFVLAVPDNYGYVALAAASHFWLNQWQSSFVGRKRKAAKILYPQAYAEKSEAAASKEALVFNCAQRAHMNTLERAPFLLFVTLFAGLRFPILATSAGAFWTFGRVFYTLGYAQGVPKLRYSRGGILAPVAEAILGITATWCAIELIIANW